MFFERDVQCIPSSSCRYGEDNLTGYRFNKKELAHKFCKTCGIQCFCSGKGPDGKETVAININTVDDLDSRALTPHHYDGKSL